MQRASWYGIVMLLGMVALLAAAELALRVRYRLRHAPGASLRPGQVTVVALGDSIVAGSPEAGIVGWPVLLAEELEANEKGVAWHVHNAGVSGDTAPRGYRRFDTDVAAARPHVVLIAFGLNDCNLGRRGLDRWLEGEVPHGLERSYLWSALRVQAERWARRAGWLTEPGPENEAASSARTSPDGFSQALAALVAKTKALGARPVLLTMTPLASVDTEAVRLRARTYDDYDARIRAMASAEDIPLVEFSSAMPPAASLSDGIHLTQCGQAWVARQVYRQLAAIGLWAELAEKDRQ